MNKKIKWLMLAPLLIASGASLTSCGSSSDVLYLRVINSEDYIYLQDKTDPESAEDLVVQFEKSDAVKDLLTKYPEYKSVKVVYDTSDTNETLYSELQTGKSNYDLMNVSDYMAQKIVASKMAVPLYQNGCEIPNYENYASKTIKGRLDQIVANQVDYSTGKAVDNPVPLKDYAVGYMWGTLGVLFNPTYPTFANSGLTKEQVINDMQDFDTLWNPRYKGTISIKNSMRDTYALGLLHAFKNGDGGFLDLKTKYDEGTLSLEEYQQAFSKLFNRSDIDAVNAVKYALDELKNNIFGLEVDSGKQDIITKKIGVNLAWSGDAVYSMDQGEDLTQVTELVELCYSVPELGSNLWFDAWIMPNCSRSAAQYECAHLFLDFLCDPANAYQNMEYTGYTSFIGGDSIVDLVREWYDARYEEVYDGDDGYQVYYADETSKNFGKVDFNTDFFSTRDSSKDNYLLYAFVPYEDDNEELIEEPTSYEELIANSYEVLIDPEDEESDQKTYADLTLVDDTEEVDENGECPLEEVNLTYFFDGTLDEYATDNKNMVFYGYYLPYYQRDAEGEIIEIGGVKQKNISVGRQFFCQYPSEEVINRCAVMEDYGKNNTNVMKMWENFKSDPLPTWAIVTFAIIGVGIAGFITISIVNNQSKKSLKKKRKQK